MMPSIEQNMREAQRQQEAALAGLVSALAIAAGVVVVIVAVLA